MDKQLNSIFAISLTVWFISPFTATAQTVKQIKHSQHRSKKHSVTQVPFPLKKLSTPSLEKLPAPLVGHIQAVDLKADGIQQQFNGQVTREQLGPYLQTLLAKSQGNKKLSKGISLAAFEPRYEEIFYSYFPGPTDGKTGGQYDLVRDNMSKEASKAEHADSHRDYKEACRCYARALEMARYVGDRDAITIYSLHWGLVYEKNGQFDIANRLFSEALHANPPNIEHLLLVGIEIAQAYRDEGRYKEAIAMFRGVLAGQRLYHKTDPYSGFIASTLGQIGNCYSFQGKYKEALPFYEQTEKHGWPDNHSFALQNLGGCNLALGNLNAARKFYLQASKLEPKNYRIREILASLKQP
jgi:tetratricopeptide (TPR) repeat protein